MLKVFTIIAVLSLISCSPSGLKKNADDQFIKNSYPIALKQSYRHWLGLKDDYGNNYSYERDSIILTGFNSSTKLVIKNDQVENRYFFEWQTGNTPSLTWREDFTELGLHDQGASVKTLDELYKQCETVVLSKSITEYAITLTLDRLNLLKQCSYTKVSCDQNCTKGIRIQGLSIL
jgi:hypothetical protein